MRIRVVDYVASLGGGIRFTTELLRALISISEVNATFEMVSYAGALASYEKAFKDASLTVPFLEIAPANWRRTCPIHRVLGIPGTRRIQRILGFGSWVYELDSTIWDGVDVVWLPWTQRHRVPESFARRAVGSFHDTICVELPVVSARERACERKNTAEQLRSEIQFVASGKATVRSLVRLYGVPEKRVRVVPLSVEHEPHLSTVPAVPQYNWMDRPFLLCVAGVSPHKNHETLLKALAQWPKRHRLVLIGHGANLRGTPRGAELKRLAKKLGLKFGDDIIPLGHVNDAVYLGLLERACALVMPSVAEGGGSFPVGEALVRGVPVLCSDIPPMQEFVDRNGGEVLWFAATDDKELAARLQELQRNYPAYKQRAVSQVSRLARYGWDDVAREYWQIFRSIEAETSYPSQTERLQRACR